MSECQVIERKEILPENLEISAMMKREKRREEEREREILGKLGAERRRMIQVRVIGELKLILVLGLNCSQYLSMKCK
jgi:hypothetical protein